MADPISGLSTDAAPAKGILSVTVRGNRGGTHTAYTASVALTARADDL